MGGPKSGLLGGPKVVFSGAQKWAEMLNNSCILGGPQQKGRNQSTKKQKNPQKKGGKGNKKKLAKFSSPALGPLEIFLMPGARIYYTHS